MRKRYLVSAGVAIAMVAGGAVAFADPFGAEPENSSSSTTQAVQGSVVLPTGDVATLGSDGKVNVKETADRKGTGHVSPSAVDGSGDAIVIPKDKIADLAAENEDPRRYNVSALLRSGQTDAAEADVEALGDKEYGQFGPAAESSETAEDPQQVTASYTDHTGETASEALALAYNTETGDVVDMETEEGGTVTGELPPGEYDIVGAGIGTDDATVSSVTPVTVEDEALEVEVDGTEANQANAVVEDDPDASQPFSTVDISSVGEEGGASILTSQEAEGESYALPVENGEASDRTMVYTALQESDAGRYNLAFEEADGVPEELEYSVSAADLAQVETQYQSLGSEQSGYVSACGGFESQIMVLCSGVETDFPAEVTEYYIPGDDINWGIFSDIGDDLETAISVVQNGQSFEPGEQENSVGAGPFGVNLTGGIIGREADTLMVDVPALQNANPDELVVAGATTGSVTVSKDGEELDSTEEPYGELTLPEGDSGRYTVTLETALDDELTPLGTETSTEWEFESEPTEEFAPVDLSSLAFDAAGVENGYAPAGEPQEFTLDYLPQDDATEADLEEVTFEVSYDDGENWEEVELDVEGNTASGALEHEEGGEFVSYRATATDDSGNQLTTTNIRSYGLS